MTEFNPTPEHGWTCFHCGEHFAPTFAGQRAAAVHFGPTPNRVAACIYYDAVELRKLESQLEAYRNEDTELHREIEKLKSDHAIALRREEEKGYAKGLHDARYVGEERSGPIRPLF